jgi:hypothetical protein
MTRVKAWKIAPAGGGPPEFGRICETELARVFQRLTSHTIICYIEVISICAY